MSTLEMIYEKSKTLPDQLQAEALSFVEYLSRRSASKSEAGLWRDLSCETRSLPAVRQLTDEDITTEITAYHATK
jgi:hypothetical protein